MKSQTDVLLAAYTDVYLQAGATHHPKDISYILRRFENEGISFMTITLPSFCKAFEKCLAAGRVLPSSFPGFSHDSKASLPRFLSGLSSKIFSKDGVLLNNPSTIAIWGIRQICLLMKKIELPCTQEREEQAVKQYVKTDRSIPLLRTFPTSDLLGLKRIFNSNYSSVLQELEQRLYDNALIPKHGPGSTADGLTGNSKYKMSYYEVLEDSFPPEMYLVPNMGNDGTLGRMVGSVSRTSPTSKLVSVPKTMKGPRLIAVEPTAVQYCQQAILRDLVGLLDASPMGKWFNFHDQTVNASKALDGSIDGSYSTYDLSEASDRVPASLISYLLKNFPLLRKAVFACRSPRVRLPDGSVMALRKFASMGSALTFPFEAMVFHTIVEYGIRRAREMSLLNDKSRAVEIYVFGDDIIVPKAYSTFIAPSLQFFGMKVNIDKSFSQGLFRESCGMDAYAGVNVTPTYVRAQFWGDKWNPRQFISLVSTINQLYAAGLWKTSDLLIRYVERRIGRLHLVSGDVGGLALHTFQHNMLYRNSRPLSRKLRYNASLYKFEARMLVPVSDIDKEPMNGYNALMKFFISPSEERKNLMWSTVPYSTKLQSRWVALP